MKAYEQMWAEENHNCYDLEPALVDYSTCSKKKFGFGIKSAFAYAKDYHAEMYYELGERERMAEEAFKFLTNGKKYKFLLSEIKKSIKDMDKAVEKTVKEDMSKLSNEGLWQLYDYFFRKMCELFTCYSITQPEKISKLEETLFSHLEMKNVGDVNEDASLLTRGDVKFEFLPDGNKLFKSFSETIQNEDAVIDKKIVGRKMAAEKKINQKERDARIKELKLTKEAVEIADIIRALGEERMRMRFSWMPALYYNELFLTELKRRHGVPKKDIRKYDKGEFDELVKKGKKLPGETIENRKIAFVKILEGGKIKALDGKKAEEFIKKVSLTSEKNEVQGRVASTGYAVGRAIILSFKKAAEMAEKMDRMEKGQIIITEMTRPNIVMACAKSGGIITDEGGILSHAAIISREFNVPCIVGTQNATKVFKDGDYIELDGKNGTARKISKEEYQEKTKK